MLNRIIDRFCRFLELLVAVFLAIMVVMVFGNVVLRYGFNSGIIVSEELSRWLFIWVTFLGAVIALKEHTHLGSDMLVSRLSVRGKRACFIVSHLLMLYITWIFLLGSIHQVKLNWNVEAASSGWSVGIFYAAGIVFSVLGGLLLMLELVRAVTGRLQESELVTVQESEERAELDTLRAELAEAKPPAGTRT